MLPNCSRLSLNAPLTRLVSTAAGPAGNAVLAAPDLVREILQNIEDPEKMKVCNAVQSWCNTTRGNQDMCSDENHVGWSKLTEQVFENYVAPPQFEVYVYRPPEGYSRKGWFKELCMRHGKVLDQSKRVNYYTRRSVNTEDEVKDQDIVNAHEKEEKAQLRLLTKMGYTFFSDDGKYFSDEIFASGPYKGLNELDKEVFQRQS